MEDDTTSVSVLLGIAAGLLGLFWSVILAPHIYRILRPSIVAYPWDEGSKSNDNNTKEETNKKNNQTVVFAASYNPPHRGHLRMLEYLSKKYDRVIAVVGFNPDKKYPVSPEERAGLLREMLKSRTENVTVEGEWWQCLCLACVWFLLCLIVWKIVDLARGYPLWNTSSSCPITTVVSKYIVFHRARSFGGSFLPSFLCRINASLVVDGYIWRYSKRVHATLFFRGIRSWEKDGEAEQYLQILNTWGPLVYGPLAIPIPTIYIEGDPKYNHVSSTLIRSICDSSSSGGDEQTKNTEASLSELVPSVVAGKVAKLYGAKL
jgi:cytidyltransferase-like protein